MEIVSVAERDISVFVAHARRNRKSDVAERIFLDVPGLAISLFWNRKIIHCLFPPIDISYNLCFSILCEFGL